MHPKKTIKSNHGEQVAANQSKWMWLNHGDMSLHFLVGHTQNKFCQQNKGQS